MAFDKYVERYNREYLADCIKNGELVGDEFSFKMIDKTGDPNGYTVKYNIKTGFVTRVDNNTGKSVEFGHPDKSIDARGYLTIELCVPYDLDTHEFTNPKNFYTVSVPERPNLKAIASVQHTCYIHNLGSIIKRHLDGEDLLVGGVCNHKDGCKFHNWLDNLEDSSRHDNGLHGAVLQSMIHHGVDVCEAKNKRHTFRHVKEGFSVNDVTDFMETDDDIHDEILNCYLDLKDLKNIIANGNEVRWVSVNTIDEFKEYIKNKTENN